MSNLGFRVVAWFAADLGIMFYTVYILKALLDYVLK